MVKHPIAPVWDKNSKVLILGSFPSLKSREQCFYYGHPQNRFWRVLAEVFGQKIPITVEEKHNFLIENNVAVWDVIKECEISKSSDITIKNVVPNDLSIILENSSVKQIFTNGKTAEKYYKKYIENKTGIVSVCLPSSSPANAGFTLEKLIEKWQIIKKEDKYALWLKK